MPQQAGPEADTVLGGAPAAVVVNHDAGDALLLCVASLRADGVGTIVVVDNDSQDGSISRLEVADPTSQVVFTGANLGYGRAVNRGLDLIDSSTVLVCNPDLVVHPGALSALRDALEADRDVAIVGPRILESDGTRYPSARRFPSWTDAAGHAMLGSVVPDNRFSRRYRMSDLALDVASSVDWVSGACFMARRQALQDLGGFDERYFMYLEDVDLCWRAHRAGFVVRYVPAATVTHIQGLSTARNPYRMMVAHHRSALLFAARRTTGWRRVGLLPVALALSLRLVVSLARQALGRRRGQARPGD